jgi:predicted CoA-substrate-specific enzyme activase
MIFGGIDAGSRTLKVVLLRTDGPQVVVIAEAVADQGVDQNALALQLFQRLLDQHGIQRGEVRRVVATGYGRKLIDVADETITEITCQGRGVRHRVPDARTIVDIGGQDSKLVRLNGAGAVGDFVMNDRCAAGTGRFLEVLAVRLGVPLPSLGELVSRSEKSAIISSMCVVFAETEIIGLLASGIAPEDIVSGVQAAIASRVAAMAGRNVTPPVVFTGGVAMVPGMEAALETALRQPITIAPQPQITAALGAALLAARQWRAERCTHRQ